MKKNWKKTVAFVLSLAIVAGPMTADVGVLLGNNSVYADEEEGAAAANQAQDPGTSLDPATPDTSNEKTPTWTKTDEGVTYAFYEDDATLYVSGEGVLKSGVFDHNNHYAEIKNIVFDKNAKISSIRTMWFAEYASGNSPQLESIEINSTVPLELNTAAIVYHRQDDSSVDVTINAPSVTLSGDMGFGRPVIDSFDSPINIKINTESPMQFLKGQFSKCYNSQTINLTIPENSTCNIPASYKFNDEDLQHEYDNVFHMEGTDEAFWRSHTGLVNGTDYTKIADPSTETLTDENAAKLLFGDNNTDNKTVTFASSDSRTDLREATIITDTKNKTATLELGNEVVSPDEYDIAYYTIAEDGGKGTAINGFPAEYGEYYAEATAKETSENYKGTKLQTFEYKDPRIDLAAAKVTPDLDEEKVSVTLNNGNETVTVPEEEYSVKYYKLTNIGSILLESETTEFPTEVGTYKARVEANKESENYRNYALSDAFKIEEAKNLADADVTTTDGGLVVKIGDRVIAPKNYDVKYTFLGGLTASTDFPTTPGKYTAEITAKESSIVVYGEKMYNFVIEKRDLANAEASVSLEDKKASLTMGGEPISENEYSVVYAPAEEDTLKPHTVNFSIATDGKTVDKDGVKCSEAFDTYNNITSGKFTTESGTFTQIVVKADDISRIGEDWIVSGDNKIAVWKGNAAEVPFRWIMGNKGDVSIEFTGATGSKGKIDTEKATAEFPTKPGFYAAIATANEDGEIYTGTKTETFRVPKADLETAEYTVDAKKKEVTLTINGEVVPTSDYDISYNEKGSTKTTYRFPEDAGDYEFEAVAKAGSEYFEGTKEGSFLVAQKELSQAEVEVNNAEKTVTVTFDGKEVPAEDYTVLYGPKGAELKPEEQTRTVNYTLSTDGKTVDKDGVKCSAAFDTYNNITRGQFTTESGTFTKIVVKADDLKRIGEGWTVSADYKTATWEGNAAEVQFGWIMGNKGDVSIEFTVSNPAVGLVQATEDFPVKPGEYTAYVSANEDSRNYTGVTTKDFTVEKFDIADAEITPNLEDNTLRVTLDGEAIPANEYDVEVVSKEEFEARNASEKTDENLLKDIADKVLLAIDEASTSDEAGVSEVGIGDADAGTPGESAEAPAGTEDAATPGEGTETPGESAETPGEGTETPGESAETPGEGTETPGEGTETPGESAETPGEGTETPGESAETPGEGTETPGESAEASEFKSVEFPTKPAEYVIIVTAKEESETYKGEATADLVIKPKNLVNADVTVDTKNKTVTVELNGEPVPEEEYFVTLIDVETKKQLDAFPTAPGEYIAAVNAAYTSEYYVGGKNEKFTIAKIDIAKAAVTVDTTKKTVAVKLGKTVIPAADYTVTFTQEGVEGTTSEFPTEPGNYQAIVEMNESCRTYTGSAKKDFTVADPALDVIKMIDDVIKYIVNTKTEEVESEKLSADIEAIEKAYAALNEAAQGRVTNYDDLKIAKACSGLATAETIAEKAQAAAETKQAAAEKAQAAAEKAQAAAEKAQKTAESKQAAAEKAQAAAEAVALQAVADKTAAEAAQAAAETIAAEAEAAKTAAEKTAAEAEKAQADAEKAQAAAEKAQAAAETKQATAEKAQKTAETAKAAAEKAQAEAEAIAKQATTDKTAAEKAQAEAEKAQAAAEKAQAEAEKAQADAETAAKQAEADKATAELAQAEAEAIAKQATTDKTAAEKAQAAAEKAQATAEKAQKTAETNQAAAEKAAKQAEADKATAELAQAAAETIAAEAQAAQAEAEEVAEVAQKAQAAAEKAQTAAEAAKTEAEAKQAVAEEVAKTAEAEAEQAMAEKAKTESKLNDANQTIEDLKKQLEEALAKIKGDTPDTPGTDEVLGDANNDKKLNIMDASFIAKKLSLKQGDELPTVADYNKDGKKNVLDALAIASYLANKKSGGAEKVTTPAETAEQSVVTDTTTTDVAVVTDNDIVAE